MSPSERALRMQITGDIYNVIKKIERKAIEQNQKPNIDFINGMYLAAAIVEERRDQGDQ